MNKHCSDAGGADGGGPGGNASASARRVKMLVQFTGFEINRKGLSGRSKATVPLPYSHIEPHGTGYKKREEVNEGAPQLYMK
jgi:hypothetical protein